MSRLTLREMGMMAESRRMNLKKLHHH